MKKSLLFLALFGHRQSAPAAIDPVKQRIWLNVFDRRRDADFLDDHA